MQNKTKSIGDKQPIDYLTVDFIELHNQSVKVDTVSANSKKLTIEQAKIFIDKWNRSKAIGLYKFITLYRVDITFKDGTKRSFRINGKNIKENTDYCFDLGDSQFIERLWSQIK